MSNDLPVPGPIPDAAAVAIAAAAASAAGRAMAQRRLKLLGAKGRRALAAHAGKAQWAGMSAKDRSLEVRRRLALGKKRRAARNQKKLKAARG